MAQGYEQLDLHGAAHGSRAQAQRQLRSWLMSGKLAYRNLFHDRMSLAVTLTGIVFSVLLLSVQLGLYIGSERMIAAMHDHSNADLWLIPAGTECFDDASLLEGRERFAVLTVKGVKSVEELIAGYALWRRPTGGSAAVLVIGSDQKAGTLVPWNIVDGNVKALAAPSAVSVDQTYLSELGVEKAGSLAEINGTRVSVAAVSQGIRSFTTVPYVFTTLERARSLIFAGPQQATYALVKLERGAKLETVKAALAKRFTDLEVLTHEEFRTRGLDYWLFETGAGSALITGAFMGLIVGLVIVAQTLYASTKDHLNEFATLRALGAPAAYIYRVILMQAILSAILGYSIGLALSLLAVWASQYSSLFIVMTPELALTLFVLTVGMCIFAALGAILKVTRIDPASVFSR
ncbi:MAG: FtsX-like permease family protein [Hyphomicrobium sp.]